MTAPVKHYRIPCPSDHIVTVPATLLDEELICPHCNSRFLADLKASIEYADDQTAAGRIPMASNSHMHSCSTRNSWRHCLGISTLSVVNFLHKGRFPEDIYLPAH